MSAKYDCQDIRSEIVQHLKVYYPDKLEDFDKEKEKPLFSSQLAAHDFRLLSVTRNLNAPVVLPLMFYFCAIRPLDVIFKAYETLTPSEMELIILGREKLTKSSYEAGVASFLPMKHCASSACYEKRVSLIDAHVDYGTYSPPIFPLQTTRQDIVAADQEKFVQICGSCLEHYQVSVFGVRDEFWESLPEIFKMGSWDKLRRATVV